MSSVTALSKFPCPACGAQAEVLQKITDAPLKKCPECGKSRLVKLVSAPVFRLKGGGWYETDFKADSEKKRNLVEKGGDDAGASAAKTEPSTDTAAKEAVPAAEAVIDLTARSSMAMREWLRTRSVVH